MRLFQKQDQGQSYTLVELVLIFFLWAVCVVRLVRHIQCHIVEVETTIAEPVCRSLEGNFDGSTMIVAQRRGHIEAVVRITTVGLAEVLHRRDQRAIARAQRHAETILAEAAIIG